MTPGVETTFQELKRYVAFDEADAENLADFCRLAEPHFERIAQEFYERIREHEGAHAVFTGDAQIVRLQKSLQRWMKRALTGPYDEAYYEETRKIGYVHVKVGLPQRYMLTAMALIRVAFDRIAEQSPQPARTRESIHRLLDLELAIMLEGYRDHDGARLRRLESVPTPAADVYATAVELADVLVIGVDGANSIRLFNEAAVRASGLERDEALGTTFLDALIPPELHGAHAAALQDAKKGQIITLHSTLRARSGKVRSIRWRVVAPPQGQGGDVAVFHFGEDTTEETARADRQKQQEKLAAVGTLAAGLAHEIRNPLNGAQLHVSFLERALKKGHPEALEAVHVVGDEIKRLARLVTEFLDFARPRPLELEPVVLASLCERIAQLTKVQLDLPSRALVVEADRRRLEQVLINLVNNAFEAGGTKVILRARRLPHHAILEVEDNGHGLPSHDAPIFDPFFSTKPNGTGLGLAISHRIVTDHGGHLEFESAPGHTIFRVTLPLER
jgi:PAS domain S-box-containing protein